jgi:hypothetical protein
MNLATVANSLAMGISNVSENPTKEYLGILKVKNETVEFSIFERGFCAVLFLEKMHETSEGHTSPPSLSFSWQVDYLLVLASMGNEGCCQPDDRKNRGLLSFSYSMLVMIMEFLGNTLSLLYVVLRLREEFVYSTMLVQELNCRDLMSNYINKILENMVSRGRDCSNRQVDCAQARSISSGSTHRQPR